MGDLEALAPQLGGALRFHDPVAIDGVAVNATIEPRDKDDLSAVLAALGDARCAAVPLGAGTQLGLGNAPQRADCFLSLAAFSRIDELDASEGVCHAGAGTPLAELRARAREAGWELPLDDAGRGGTLGGALATAALAPRALGFGRPRDVVLGCEVVLADGLRTRCGGRVVKNVTGYDLCKLLAGSWGTLAVMTEVTLKVMPRPESERTLVLQGLDDLTANRAMTAALGSPFDVSGAAHVPNSAFRVAVDALGDLGSPQQAVTLLRLEGITASATHRAAALGKALTPFGTAQIIEDAASMAVWSSVRDIKPFAADGALGAWPVWRIVCPPASGGALGQALSRDTGGDVIYDWGGGLIWAALPPKPDAQAALVRARVNAVGGHATLLRASEQVRRDVDVFHPQQGGLAALAERVRHSFDPKSILNRGRMIRGFAA